MRSVEVEEHSFQVSWVANCRGAVTGLRTYVAAYDSGKGHLQAEPGETIDFASIGTGYRMVKTKFARRLLRYSRLQGTRPSRPSGEDKKLTSNDNPGRHVAQAQAAGHGQGHDYDKGSPHLRHRQLRTMVEERLTRMVRDVIAVNDTCQVVEIGAGHGRFTAALLAAGARIDVTETSRASADGLEQAYSTDSRVTVLFDETGEGGSSGPPRPGTPP